MKKRLPTIFLILILIAGLSLLLYPTVSDWWNSFHQSQAIAQYAENVADLDDDEYEKLLSDARNYNRTLNGKAARYEISDEESKEYEKLLNISGDGIMGYIDIPIIGCSLPIYHGTNESVLQIAIGHIEGTSLPVGGESTHCVLSGHRGLPSAKLFSDLDKLVEGDTFILHILKDDLTYEVDQIRIVEPKEVSDLMIEEGKDYCTLVTCTPYGINTHRILVRGHRIENMNDSDVRITSDALQIDSMLVAPIIAAPILLVLVIIVFVKPSKKK